MKNFLKTLLIGAFAITTLTGCGETYYSKEYIEAKALMSEQERKLIDYFSAEYSYTSYNRLYRAISVTRVAGNETLNENGDLIEAYKEFEDIDLTKPFCGYAGLITEIEKDWNNTAKEYSISGQWKDAKGEFLSESCGISKTKAEEVVEDTIKPTPEQTNQQIIDDTVTIKEETLLSPAKVRELKTSIGECNIAKTKLIMLTDNNRYLTEKDYDVVTKLILDCEYDGLRNEMNK